MNDVVDRSRIASRFRGFLPVVVDVETGGINPATDALLEMAVVLLGYDEHGCLAPRATHAHHIQPFPGAVLNPEALAFNGIDPYHPFRMAIEEKEALLALFREVRQAVRDSGCNRAILVGHNPILDLGFLNAAVERTAIKRNPFHPFSSFDTATLAGLAYGQTVLARAVQCAGIEWDQAQAHSAIYDAERTAEVFCAIVNEWDELKGDG
jgi:ribonuclease T